jgi:hypothetical protein
MDLFTELDNFSLMGMQAVNTSSGNHALPNIVIPSTDFSARARYWIESKDNGDSISFTGLALDVKSNRKVPLKATIVSQSFGNGIVALSPGYGLELERELPPVFTYWFDPPMTALGLEVCYDITSEPVSSSCQTTIVTVPTFPIDTSTSIFPYDPHCTTSSSSPPGGACKTNIPTNDVTLSWSLPAAPSANYFIEISFHVPGVGDIAGNTQPVTLPAGTTSVTLDFNDPLMSDLISAMSGQEVEWNVALVTIDGHRHVLRMNPANVNSQDELKFELP